MRTIIQATAVLFLACFVLNGCCKNEAFAPTSLAGKTIQLVYFDVPERMELIRGVGQELKFHSDGKSYEALEITGPELSYPSLSYTNFKRSNQEISFSITSEQDPATGEAVSQKWNITFTFKSADTGDVVAQLVGADTNELKGFFKLTK